MASTPFMSRYGLPLLAVLLVHGLLLDLLGRGLESSPPVATALLPVELLGPVPAPEEGAAPTEAPAAAAVPPVATPQASLPPPAPAEVRPASPSPASVSSPEAAPTAPGGPLQAPGADTVAAAALDDPLAPPGLRGAAAPAATSVEPGLAEAARAPLPARLFPGTPEPAYPDEARRHREQGSVTLQLQVRADGRIRAVKVLRSSGSPRLDRAARDAAWRWRVLPAEREGRPVDSLFEKTLHFRLED